MIEIYKIPFLSGENPNPKLDSFLGRLELCGDVSDPCASVKTYKLRYEAWLFPGYTVVMWKCEWSMYQQCQDLWTQVWSLIVSWGLCHEMSDFHTNIKGPLSKFWLFQKWLLHPYITLKIDFWNLEFKKDLENKVENFGALVRISSPKESAIWTTYSWNFGKIFGHVIAIIKP